MEVMVISYIVISSDQKMLEEMMTALRNPDYSLDVTLAMEDIITTRVMQEGGSSQDTSMEGVINQNSNNMEEEEDAKKATNHEVFIDNKFPIERRAAATEFLIKAHKLVMSGRRSLMSSWLQRRIWW